MEQDKEVMDDNDKCKKRQKTSPRCIENREQVQQETDLFTSLPVTRA
jgi:hypothetical protein